MNRSFYSRSPPLIKVPVRSASGWRALSPRRPTVRNVELTGPYMHDGSQKTLEEVVEWYNKGGHPNPWLDEKIKPLNLNAEEKADLVAFMKALTGPLPEVEPGRLPE